MNVGKVLLFLLVVWFLIGMIGIIVKGLFFLFVIGLVLFGFTLATEGRRRGLLKR